MGWNDCFLHIIIVNLSCLWPKFSIMIGSLRAYLTRNLTYNKTLDWFSARLRDFKHQTFLERRRRLQTSEPG